MKTSQLYALHDWLNAKGVRYVAMEAAGVYALALYGVLEATGFEVLMVTGCQTRDLPGRKATCRPTATRNRQRVRRHGAGELPSTPPQREVSCRVPLQL